MPMQNYLKWWSNYDSRRLVEDMGLGNRPYQHLQRYKYLWSKCTKREVVIAAWKKLRKGKTTRREVIKIESNFEYYVDLMIETITNTNPYGDPEKAFQPRVLRPKYITEHGKNRVIYCPPIWEQWVHHIVVKVVAPIIECKSYRYSCGSMPKRGGVYGKKHLAKVIKKKGFKYFAKLDIRHFFNSIRLEIVIDELKQYIDDEYFFYLIRVIFRQFKKGLPLGFYISQWLANFMLNSMDHIIAKTKPICYIRYVDDIILCRNNKRKLATDIIRIKFCLGQLRLKLKHNYQIARFDNHANGRFIDFMGYRFYKDKTILRKSIMLRSVRNSIKLSKITHIALKQAQGMLSRLGWFKYTDTRWTYIHKVQPNISICSLKNIVRKHTFRRIENENRMAEGTPLLFAA